MSKLSSCPSCNHPLLTFGDQESCPYCGADLQEDQKQTFHSSIGPLENDVIYCWFCYKLNSSKNIRCQDCGANLTGAPSFSRDDDEEESFVRRLSNPERERFLIKGLELVQLGIMKRKRWDNIPCKSCNHSYPPDYFTCPHCGAGSLLQDLRGAIYGTLNDGQIINELQALFPRFDLMTYTNSTVIDHKNISASKIDLEDAAGRTASVILVVAEYLRSVTHSYTQRKVESLETKAPAQSSEMAGFNLSGVDMTPDRGVLDMFNVGALSGGEAFTPAPGPAIPSDRDWSDI